MANRAFVSSSGGSLSERRFKTCLGFSVYSSSVALDVFFFGSSPDMPWDSSPPQCICDRACDRAIFPWTNRPFEAKEKVTTRATHPVRAFERN